MLRRPFTLEHPQLTRGPDGLEYVRAFRTSKERLHGTMVVPLGGYVLNVIFDWRHGLPSIRLDSEETEGVSNTLTLLNSRLARQALRRALEELPTAEREYVHGSN